MQDINVESQNINVKKNQLSFFFLLRRILHNLKLLETMKKLILFVLIGIIPVNIYSQVPTDNLVLYMPFDGNAIDESGNSNNGILHGVTLTEDRFGNINSAYSFNGTSAFIELPNVIPVFKGSISYWYKTNGSNEGQVLVYWIIRTKLTP